MPKVKLSKNFIDKIKTGSKIVDYFDTEIKGLLLRHYPSGNSTYQLYYRNSSGIQKRYTIAKHGKINLHQARGIASKKLAEIYSGRDVQTNKMESRRLTTFGEYLEKFYYAWVKQNRKHDSSRLSTLKNTLSIFHKLPLNAINNRSFNTFITTYQQERGVTNARVNRIIAIFKASLNVAVNYNFVNENGIRKFKLLHEDKQKIVRYLTEAEEAKLLDVAQKFYYQYYNILILALNTGMRAGEIKSLKWNDVNIDKKYISLRSENTKAQRIRFIPLNYKALEAITHQQVKQKTDVYVFTNPKTKSKYTEHKSWFARIIAEANIQNFRFHDLRHTFASKLVMRGVDLNTVRELMGHSDIKMTLVYAHLAPEHKQKAVDLL